MKKLLSHILILTLVISLLAGCNNTTTTENQDSETVAPPIEVDFSKTDADMFTERDSKIDYDESKVVTIQLNGTSSISSSNSVKISGSTVTITEEATYVVSGELTDGMLIVDAPDTAKLQIVLNGANITSKTSAALYILEADKVFLTLADGTTNTLANGGTFTAIDDNNIDAALFSKQDLTLNGTGSLTVTSPAGHGVVCKDDLVIAGGTYTVNSSSHGLDANDSVRIANATLNIDAGKDAIHAENTDDASLGFVYIGGGTIKAEAEGDGIAAGAYMQIVDGAIDLLVGGGAENGTKASSGNYGGFMGGGHGGMRPGGNQNSTTTTEDTVSMKGLKATNSLLISGGNITINSADDSVHSDVSVIINGGTITIASGDDAIHAEDTLTVTAGKIDISESYEGLEALHIDVQGGDIKLKASDDGLNAAGGTDQSGAEGGRDGMFGGGKPGGMGGHGGKSSSSNGSIKISGGTLYINSSGDGLDANGTLEISGGHTTVVGPTQGDTATLDYDKSGIITGGTFIGTGAAGGMAQSFSDSEQGVIAISVGNQSAGAKIILKNKSGKTIIEHSPELNFAAVILSSPEIKKGDTYTVSVGSESGEFEAS
ncbi:MAG: carbohydrate-binding domain-containing protein [Ruminococcaceae bacterium]|nr:carbohydrate-binding domain-containing protein [Oscillospiraceae bacterium]